MLQDRYLMTIAVQEIADNTAFGLNVKRMAPKILNRELCSQIWQTCHPLLRSQLFLNQILVLLKIFLYF